VTMPADPDWGTDPSGPVFFLSYARPHPARDTGIDASSERQSWVARFFDELSEHVCELVGSRTGASIGFLDRSMRGGEEWVTEMLDAVRTAGVFVPLISPSYLRSEWCGKEWHLFSSRPIVPLRTQRRWSHTAIVPVTWLSTENVTVPDVVTQVQRFGLPHLEDPALISRYERHGVYGLLASRAEDDYHRVVWHLARRVAEIYFSVRPEPARDTTPALQIRNAFRKELR
jgi:hypothetical protein